MSISSQHDTLEAGAAWRREATFDLSFLSLMVLLYYAWPLLIPGMDLLGGDALLLSAPTRQPFVDSVRQGALPFWNPYVGSGVPALAAWQGACLYPPHLLLLAISPVPYASRVILLLHYLLQAFGMYGLVRHGLGLRRESGLFAGAALALCAFNAAKAEQFIIVAVAAWIPILLWAWIAWLRRPASNSFIAFTVSLSMALLAGHPQLLVYALYSIAFLTCFPPFRTGTRGGKEFILWRLRRLLGLGAALALAGLVCGAQLLPTLELIPYSMRSANPPDYGAGWSFPPRLLLQFIHPGMLPRWDGSFPVEENPAEMAAFAGRATVGLALLALALCWRNSAVRNVFFLTIILVILAFGRFGPMGGGLFHAADSYLPGWKGLRVPARLLFLADVCLILLAAHGLDPISRKIAGVETVSTSSEARKGLAFVLGMALCALCAVEEYPVAAKLPLRYAKRFNPPAPSSSLPLLFQSRPGTYRTFTLIPKTEGTRSDADTATVRIATMEPNIGAQYRISGIETYGEGLLPLIRSQDFLMAWRGNILSPRPDATLLGLMGVRYVASDGPISGADWVPVAQLAPAGAGRGNVAVFENRSWKEIVSWAAEAEAACDLSALDGQFISTGALTAPSLLPRPLPRGSSKSTPPAAGRIAVSRPSPNRLIVEKDSVAEGDMLFSTSAYPGWVARWKGGSQALAPVNAIHLRFHAPPGADRIILAFEPFSFRLGLFMSMAGLCLLAACGALTTARRI